MIMMLLLKLMWTRKRHYHRNERSENESTHCFQNRNDSTEEEEDAGFVALDFEEDNVGNAPIVQMQWSKIFFF